MSLLQQLISLVAPPICPACGTTMQGGRTLCDRCRNELAVAPRVLEAGPSGVDLAVSASPFDGVARQLVHGLKFGRRLALAGVAAEAMLHALPPYELASNPVNEPPDAVVPVPAGALRWRWRGFDPAEEIAIAVADRSGIPLRKCLRRDRGRRQVGRRRRQRLADPPTVRAVAAAPGTALLVDDVWTTGATLAACAKALRIAGSRRVLALTLARAL